ncbi:MAG: alkaline phosphatase [Bacteroidales bacterium]|nr:alkaline phosphatase [Bacteroidales bacterium]
MKKTYALFVSGLCLCILPACGGKTDAPRAGHVLLIGIDGWAAEAIRQAPAEDLPNIHYLMDHGSWTLSKRSVMPSASAINWASMVNGLPTEMHGMDKWNSTRGTIPSTSDNGHGIPPTLFTLIREQRPEAETGCIFDWDGIGPITDTLAMSYHHFIKTYTSTDDVLVPVSDYAALGEDYIKEKKPLFFFHYFGTLDEAGHTKGWYSEAYMERQRTLDRAVGQLIQSLKDAGIFEDTVIVMSADHGGKDRGHGGFTLLELETPFIVCGKGIKEGHEISAPLMQYDTPAIIADILGIRVPDDWRGRPLGEIYED